MGADVGRGREFCADDSGFRFIVSPFFEGGKTRQKVGSVSSLRRHYPDQVQRVDGKRSHPLSRVYPSSPLTERTKSRVYKRWLFGFFEEIAWPVRPAGLLRFWTEINL